MMRIVIGLLACLSAGALTPVFADPPAEPATAAQAAPAAPATPASTAAPAATAAATPVATGATQVITAKAELDKDTKHFLAEGFRPEMRGGEQVYCKKETVLGSRLAAVKNCGTIEQLKINELHTQSGISDAQRQQSNPTFH